jgi:hypothetical protein
MLTLRAYYQQLRITGFLSPVRAFAVLADIQVVGLLPQARRPRLAAAIIAWLRVPNRVKIFITSVRK